MKVKDVSKGRYVWFLGINFRIIQITSHFNLLGKINEKIFWTKVIRDHASDTHAKVRSVLLDIVQLFFETFSYIFCIF